MSGKIDPLFAPKETETWADFIPELKQTKIDPKTYDIKAELEHRLRHRIADALDPLCPPDGDALLGAIHADIQNNRPEISVEHRNIVLHAASAALRKWQ